MDPVLEIVWLLEDDNLLAKAGGSRLLALDRGGWDGLDHERHGEKGQIESGDLRLMEGMFEDR